MDGEVGKLRFSVVLNRKCIFIYERKLIKKHYGKPLDNIFIAIKYYFINFIPKPLTVRPRTTPIYTQFFTQNLYFFLFSHPCLPPSALTQNTSASNSPQTQPEPTYHSTPAKTRVGVRVCTLLVYTSQCSVVQCRVQLYYTKITLKNEFSANLRFFFNFVEDFVRIIS